MLDSNEYIVVWAAYLLATSGILLVWWKLTSYLPWIIVKNIFRVAVAAVLMVPVPVTSGSADWAPAVLVLLFETTLSEQNDLFRVATPLLSALALGLLVVLAESFWRYRRHNESSPSNTTS